MRYIVTGLQLVVRTLLLTNTLLPSLPCRLMTQ